MFNALGLRPDGCHFADDAFKSINQWWLDYWCICVTWPQWVNVWVNVLIFADILIDEKYFKISLKCVLEGLIDLMSALVQVMACCLDKMANILQRPFQMDFPERMCKYLDSIKMNFQELQLTIASRSQYFSWKCLVPNRWQATIWTQGNDDTVCWHA